MGVGYMPQSPAEQATAPDAWMTCRLAAELL